MIEFMNFKMKIMCPKCANHVFVETKWRKSIVVEFLKKCLECANHASHVAKGCQSMYLKGALHGLCVFVI